MTKKHVLIGVCGGVSAYKACDLVSKLSKLDYEIKVMMTENATKFVPPLIFESLSHNSVEVDLCRPCTRNRKCDCQSCPWISR